MSTTALPTAPVTDTSDVIEVVDLVSQVRSLVDGSPESVVENRIRTRLTDHGYPPSDVEELAPALLTSAKSLAEEAMAEVQSHDFKAICEKLLSSERVIGVLFAEDPEFPIAVIAEELVELGYDREKATEIAPSIYRPLKDVVSEVVDEKPPLWRRILRIPLAAMGGFLALAAVGGVFAAEYGAALVTASIAMVLASVGFPSRFPVKRVAAGFFVIGMVVSALMPSNPEDDLGAVTGESASAAEGESEGNQGPRSANAFGKSLIEARWQKKGNSYFSFHEGKLVEAKFEVEVEALELTETDKLNGIEWKGVVAASGPARVRSESGAWSDWLEGRLEAGFFGAHPYDTIRAIRKTNGVWEDFTGLEEREFELNMTIAWMDGSYNDLRRPTAEDFAQ